MREYYHDEQPDTKRYGFYLFGIPDSSRESYTSLARIAVTQESTFPENTKFRRGNTWRIPVHKSLDYPSAIFNAATATDSLILPNRDPKKPLRFAFSRALLGIDDRYSHNNHTDLYTYTQKQLALAATFDVYPEIDTRVRLRAIDQVIRDSSTD